MLLKNQNQMLIYQVLTLIAKINKIKAKYSYVNHLYRFHHMRKGSSFERTS